MAAAQVRAVIDVGTNSVKLLVASVAGHIVQPLHESSHQTRLGRGFYESHLLQAGAIRETAKSVAEFAAEAKRWTPAWIKVIATSAARDATNKQELLNAILNTAALPVEIISGEQEADWAYRGVTSDPELFSRPLLVIDVGGGSTEFILGHRGERRFAESFPIGSVRLLERIPLEDSPTTGQLERYETEIDRVLEKSVKPRLAPRLAEIAQPVQLVGTGGTSTILARIESQMESFDRERIERVVLSHATVRREKNRLWQLPLADRRKIVGLPPNRADVILPGALIFERVMTAFGISFLKVSTRGIRFAALIDP